MVYEGWPYWKIINKEQDSSNCFQGATKLDLGISFVITDTWIKIPTILHESAGANTKTDMVA